ncbi:MAG TPA: hypothetical protein VN851_03810 [Thermoanaerobaculia bacterium]|nr:hypothetical protein [Thermoanaerobaculia bacterium]
MEGILAVVALRSHFADSGMMGTVMLAFIGGSFGSNLVSGVGRMVTRDGRTND